MKIVAISDTHGQHRKSILPKADMIIHAGDISKRGLKTEVDDFCNWFSSLDYAYKIFIAGNHDFYFEGKSNDEIKSEIPDNIIYLNDSGVEIEGLKIWGSPVQPWFYDWAFNRQRGAEIKQHWDLIPSGTDILVTHGPALGILDKTIQGKLVGCEDLRNRIEEIQPNVFICGHIHEAYGRNQVGSTEFINASLLNFSYEMVNEPIVFEIEK